MITKGLLVTLTLATLLASPSLAQIDFSNFHSPAEVDAILEELVDEHPTLARLSTIGTSHEGRPIQVLKISDNVHLDETDEDDVLFVAAHHAREWITVEMALYLAEQLLVRYDTDPQLRADIDNLEIWIVPIVNPDGVAYSWLPTGDRMWRKNRALNADGVDDRDDPDLEIVDVGAQLGIRVVT
ncbi:MAG: M14 family zinc carboxypeptidase, partial [Acidobacteriota bacterium]